MLHLQPRRPVHAKRQCPLNTSVLNGSNERLQPQDQGVHQPEGIHDVKSDAPHGAGVFRGDHVVVVGIGVGDAAAARRDAVQPACVERLEIHQERAGPRHLLRVDQLLAAAELAGSDDILHVGDHHRDDGPGLRYAGHLGDHSDFHDLRFDLPKAGLQAPLTRSLRNQHSRPGA